MDRQPDRLVPLDEAAPLMGTSAASIRSARKNRTLVLPIVKTGPRSLTVRQSDIEAVVAGAKPVFESRKAAARRIVDAGGE